MVNVSEIVVLLRHILVFAEKERVLGKEKGRTNLGERKSVETYRNCKN